MRTRILAVAVSAVAVGALFVGCKPTSAGSNGPAGALAHPEDYQITQCGPRNALDMAQAKVTITNHSGGSSNYTGTVRFESPDHKTQYGTGPVIVTNLTPGQSATETAIGSTVPAGAQFVCVLADADRTASY